MRSVELAADLADQRPLAVAAGIRRSAAVLVADLSRLKDLEELDSPIADLVLLGQARAVQTQDASRRCALT